MLYTQFVGSFLNLENTNPTPPPHRDNTWFQHAASNMVDVSYYYDRLAELGVEDPRAATEHYPFVFAQRNPCDPAVPSMPMIGVIYFNIQDLVHDYASSPLPRAWGKNDRLDDHYDLRVFRCTDRACGHGNRHSRTTTNRSTGSHF